ncbi:hypothetical protein [Streptomyces sp. NBC_01237]|uniref:hypothetical protein n=1 Tax=Streptomyces sp. NBC_01237 TaxID=2903790 RepID=UPI002DD8A83E|nr:hypothetical protein [Streptomyces sp. NBC_01237]WRZ76495.1 hypothetical protein OG251_35495 [Streptomyces sp. NBC_01237]
MTQIKRERTNLQHRLDAAATVIAALHHDNTALREELAAHSTIVDLDQRRTARPDVIGPC